jgi:hypothetical protein
MSQLNEMRSRNWHVTCAPSANLTVSMVVVV